MSALAFVLPERLEAHEPPEARGLRRDDVRMLVARRGAQRLGHARFGDLRDVLEAGDLLVVNTSGTLPAALPARPRRGAALTLHLSTPLPGVEGRAWVVELRDGLEPFSGSQAGEILELPGGARAELLAPFLSGPRLWAARLHLPEPVPAYLARHGRPIRYRHSTAERPLGDYQTAYATEPGSAEMPSAGRPFTPELITELVARGIAVAPLLLHAGVSSLERGERPYPERFRVPQATARLVNATRSGGGRVVAVGTTVVRALETVARPDGTVEPGEGWTRLVVTAERDVRAVDGLLTGWHEPDASHLQMLEALAGPQLVARSYAAALEHGYLWHEFGDSHLLLPERSPQAAAARRARSRSMRARPAAPIVNFTASNLPRVSEDVTVSRVTPRVRGRRKVPREVREREMLEVAERAFASRGFHNASVDAIAEGSGISKPMVYAYFGSKEGLYRACMARARGRLFESLQAGADAGAGPDEQLWLGLLAFFKFVDEQRDSYAVLLGEATSGAGPFAADGAEVRRQVAALVDDLLRRAARAEGVEPAAQEMIQPLARALIGAAESLAGWWREHPDEPRERVAGVLMNLVWVGLGDVVRGRRWTR